MDMAREKMDRLQEWILVEAYRNGLARKKKERPAGEFGPEEIGNYFIHRHDIYLGYFKLPKDSLRYGAENGGSLSGYREVRLRSAAVLCETVRQLLRKRLIQFPEGRGLTHNQADLLRIYGSFIFLTEAGVQKAESLLSTLQNPGDEDRIERPCAA